MLVWQGRSLSGYGAWMPSAEPGLIVCRVRFEVREGTATTVTVTGFPEHARPRSYEEIWPCLR